LAPAGGTPAGFDTGTPGLPAAGGGVCGLPGTGCPGAGLPTGALPVGAGGTGLPGMPQGTPGVPASSADSVSFGFAMVNFFIQRDFA